MSSGPYTLSQLARAVGMKTDEVRGLQACGLLQRPRRSLGRPGSLAFHHEHVERLTFIRRARSLAFSLEDIARLVDSSTNVTCGDVYRLVEDHVRRLREQAGEEAPAVRQLTELMATCPRVGGRRECGILAALSQPAGAP